MDDTNRPRRQVDAQNGRFPGDAQSVRGFSATPSERYRPALTASPTASRGGSGYQGYYQEPSSSSFPTALQPNTLQYAGTGYSQDQRQQQTFTPYNPDIMYTVAPQATSTSVYESAPQFQGRQSTGMQMLSDVATPYFATESTSAPAPPSLQPHASPGSSTIYQQHQQGQGERAPLLQQNYPAHQSVSGMPQPVDVMGEDGFQPQGPGMEAAYTAYQTALKEVFNDILNGRLSEASRSLLEVSEWLLGHVGDLGLTMDEVALHGDRLRLWGEFNTAWLSIFQKQKDLLECGGRLEHPQNIMTREFINKMAKDLIRMCDAVEKHGLVDYQYGVAEEQIISIIIDCLDIQESRDVDEGIIRGLNRVPP